MTLISANLKNRAIRLSNFAFGKSQVAHHGIQRSGTNYLNLCMNSLGVQFVNSHDPARNDPSHKHFRWQEDKRSIMPWEKSYLNSIRAADINEINRIAGFPIDCKHFVIKKNIVDWTASILNWGIRVGWFRDRTMALDSVDLVIRDYKNYYGFWKDMADRFPGDIAIIEFESLRKTPRSLINLSERLNIEIKHRQDFTGIFDEVPQSPKHRELAITRDEIKLHPDMIEE